MSDSKFRLYSEYREYPPEEMIKRAAEMAEELRCRRTVRDFSGRPVDESVIRHCLWAAGSAPSGANLQPWYFVTVGASELKKQIRLAAEEEERAFYNGRAGDEWLADLSALGTNAEKPFLETAPYLIAVFAEKYRVNADGSHSKNYYVSESVGIACGMLISALHHAGLATLTHTPSPMNFLGKILGRPENERAYLLLVTGYPASGAQVPEIDKKQIGEFCTFLP